MRRRAGRAIQFGAFREPRRQQHPVFFGRLQLPGWRGRTMLQRRAPPSVAFAAFLGAAIIGGGTLAADAAGPVKQTVEIDLTLWPLRDIASVRDDPFGVLVKYGCTLFTDTASQIGPKVADPARRFAGNNLTCGNCHLQGGSQPYAMPLVGVWGQFPQYRAREGAVVTLEERINGCMERSVNGRA